MKWRKEQGAVHFLTSVVGMDGPSKSDWGRRGGWGGCGAGQDLGCEMVFGKETDRGGPLLL